MTRKSRFTRRRMLQLTGGSAVIGLAGCTGSESDGSDGGAESTATTAEDDEESGHDEEESGHDEGESDGGEGESGHDDDGGHNEAVADPSDAVEVAMVTEDGGYHFEPHVARVTVGGTVTWTNESGSHSATAYHPDNDQPQLVPDGAASWDSGVFTEEGATFEHTFETEGVYHYYCTPHETLGMIASVIVGNPDPHEAIALEEPPEEKSESVHEKLAELNGMVSTALGDDH